MRPGVFDEAVDALRALGDDRDDAAASATRLRIRDSLARGHALRRHAATLAVLAVLLVASGAWALTSGRVARWIAPAAQATAVLPEPSDPVSARPAPRITVSVPDVVAAPEAVPIAAPRVVEAPHAVARAPEGSAAVDTNAAEAEALYRAAHELHFHGDDAGRGARGVGRISGGRAARRVRDRGPLQPRAVPREARPARRGAYRARAVRGRRGRSPRVIAVTRPHAWSNASIIGLAAG